MSSRDNADAYTGMVPEKALLNLDAVRELALALGPVLNGKDLSQVQAALVLSWLMTTGALNTIPDPDERNLRASIYIQKGTAMMGPMVDEVMQMTRWDIETYMRHRGDTGETH